MTPPLLTLLARCSLFLVGAAGCSASTQSNQSSQSTAAGVAARPAPSVELRQIAAGVWLHTSYGDVPKLGRFPSNGLVVQGTHGAVIIDTAWGLGPTGELLDWASHEAGGVFAVIVTHFHDDRTSGLPEVHRRGINSYATRRTIEESKEHGTPLASHALEESGSLAALGIQGETFYPGRGHTDDNIVVWLPQSQVLFGGCLIKAGSAPSLGYLADASVGAWSSSVSAVQHRYPLARVVVPGHGAEGGPELFEHTRALAEAAAAAESR